MLTIFFGIVLYFGGSSLAYLIMWRKYKSIFTPYREQLVEYEEQKLFDIKWSIINILGQSPLVTLIKMAYPYYSKVQYSWDITYAFPLYLVFHFVYD